MIARRQLATLGIFFLLCDAAQGGGGGENMLLVVNPNDPSALQIANSYAALRDIPANNIVFLAPPPDYLSSAGVPQPIAQAEVMPDYLTPIANAISSRGLTNQINYIGTIGEAADYSITANAPLQYTTANSLNYALSLLTPLTNGSGLTLQGITSTVNVGGGFAGAMSGLYQNPTSIPIGSNPAIQHSNTYSIYYPAASQTYATQYYMSGTIGYTGTNGNTAAQVIASLQSAAASDGTHPAGVDYFEYSGDTVRSRAREAQWQYTESQLTARGIPWVQENSTTPQNRNAVLGATCGAATLTLPNGSTYLPGSWADNLTSYGCDFGMPSQTQATAFIAAGAAGTSGAVIEPYAIPQRFTNSSIDTFIADGATLGEAFAKSVATPDVQMPLGDMLAQPYADVPKVAITSSPGNYGTVRGAILVGGSAALASPRIATGIAQLELLVDGVVSARSGTIAGGSGTFGLNTTGLSDGVHEVRVVAVNNAQAASEGYTAEPIVVDNHGRSINYNGGNTTFASSAAAPVTFNLADTAGDGTISQVELTCLGRVVAQAAGAAASLNLSPAALAPGDNAIVPVAIFSDGTQTAGGTFVVHVASSAVNTWTDATNWAVWSVPGDWSGGVAPQNGDGVARFGGTAGGSVTLNVSPTVQEVDFGGNGGGSYTLAAATGQTLTLSTSSGPLGESLVNVLSGTDTVSAPLVLAAAANLVNVTNPADCLTIGGGISGSGALTKTGFGTLVFTGSNNYAGTTTISGGTLQLAPGGTLGPASVMDNSLLEVNRPDTFTLNNSIAGVGAVSQNGTNTLILAGANNYSGGTRGQGGEHRIRLAQRAPGKRDDPRRAVRGIECDGCLFDRHQLAGQRQDQRGINRCIGAYRREQREHQYGRLRLLGLARRPAAPPTAAS